MGFEYYEPTLLGEALALLDREGEDGAALAGGTDLLMRVRRGARRYRSVVNLKRVAGLDGLTWDDSGNLSIGALSTFRAIEIDARVAAAFPALVEASRVVAGVQLRNLATIGGNLGNASPSADSLPPLVALDATVTVGTKDGTRVIPVEQCMSGPGQAALEAGEIFTRVDVPAPARGSGNAYARFSPRSAMDIGIASAAAAVTLDRDGRCTHVRIALGAVSPTPLRARAAEEALMGERLSDRLLDEVAARAAQEAQPITDIRATAEYRRAIVGVLARRMVETAATRARSSGNGSHD